MLRIVSISDDAAVGQTQQISDGVSAMVVGNVPVSVVCFLRLSAWKIGHVGAEQDRLFRSLQTKTNTGPFVRRYMVLSLS